MLRNIPFARFVSRSTRGGVLIAVVVLIEFSPLIAVALLVALLQSSPPWL